MNKELRKIWRTIQLARIKRHKKKELVPVAKLPPDCKQLRDGRIFSVKREALCGHTHIWCYIQNNLVMHLTDENNEGVYLVSVKHAPHCSSLVQKYRMTGMADSNIDTLYGMALALGLDKF